MVVVSQKGVGIKSEGVRGRDNGVKNPESVTASIWAVIIREGKKQKKMGTVDD